MGKAIMFDMGETIVNNKNMNFTNSIIFLYENSKKCKVDKQTFIKEALNILNNIFKNRKFIEFKMIDYINYLIELYDLQYNITINELEEGFAFKSCIVEIIENVTEVLKMFKQKQYKIVLLSNTSFSRNVVVKMLGDLSDLFDDIILSSEVIFRKPHPNIFELGVKKLNVEKKNIFYIGNDYYCDVYGASQIGINSIWFNENKLEKNENYPVKKYIEITSYSELLNMKF